MLTGADWCTGADEGAKVGNEGDEGVVLDGNEVKD